MHGSLCMMGHLKRVTLFLVKRVIGSLYMITFLAYGRPCYDIKYILVSINCLKVKVYFVVFCCCSMARYNRLTARRNNARDKHKRTSRLTSAECRRKTASPISLNRTVGGCKPVRKQSHKGQKLNSWSKTNMQKAVEEWRKQEAGAGGERLSLRTIGRAWSIPYETLRRRVYGRVQGYESASGTPTVLKECDEVELVKTIKDLAEVGFPLTRKEIQDIAFAYAKVRGYKGFSTKKERAGYYWFQGFLSRHPDVSLKKAENLSVARSMCMNKTQVSKWFEAYEDLLKRLGIRDMPRQIWNLDESGVQNIHKADQVVGAVGCPTYNMTAVERGETSTVLAVISAFGDIPPPMVIHKGRNIGKGWKDGAPYGTLVRASQNGWINKELFTEFGEHFVKYVKSEANLNNGLPHVIVMDNHYSHVFNLDFLNLMKSNNVHVFALPSHTTHWLQPLDRVPFGSFKRRWNDEMRLFTRENAGRILDKRAFFKVFTPVWQKSMTVELAQSGFRATGLFPVDVRAVPEEAFVPSKVSERAEQICQPSQQAGRPKQNYYYCYY